MGRRLNIGLALATPLFIAGGMFGALEVDRYKSREEQLPPGIVRHVKDSQYETTLGYLIENPEWFPRSEVYIFERKKRESIQTSSGGDAKYRLIARFGIDQNNLAVERFSLDFILGQGLNRQEREQFKSFLFYNPSIQELEDYIKYRGEGLNKVSKGLPERLLKDLQQYKGWTKLGQQFKYVDLVDFNPPKKERKANNLDQHFERTFEDNIRTKFEGEERELGEEFLKEEEKAQGISLDNLSIRESVHFLYRLFTDRNKIRYSEYFGTDVDALYFSELFKRKSGNSADFAYNSAALFGVLRDENSELANTHWLPISVYGYIGNRRTLKMINGIYQSDSQKFGFIDLSGKGNIEDIKTVLFR